MNKKECGYFQENLKTIKHYYQTNWVVLGKKLKLDRAHLSEVERKRVYPYKHEIKALAKLLKVKPERLTQEKLVLNISFEKKKRKAD
ncbi:MAG: hypothetical protein H7X71_05435 [Chitinophagales bacterium]|nr:hypothetical protein [Chitinophagales bacterium]